MSEKGPTSEDLNRTVDLLAGLGDERPETGECSDQAFSSDDTLVAIGWIIFHTLNLILQSTAYKALTKS